VLVVVVVVVVLVMMMVIIMMIMIMIIMIMMISGVIRVGVTQGSNDWCHPAPTPPPPDHSKSLVIFLNLHPIGIQKKHKEKTIKCGVKAFKNYIK